MTKDAVSVVPEVASLVYGDNKPGNQLRVWQCLSKQLLASHSQVFLLYLVYFEEHTCSFYQGYCSDKRLVNKE